MKEKLTDKTKKNDIRRDIASGVGGAAIGGLMAGLLWLFKKTSDAPA